MSNTPDSTQPADTDDSDDAPDLSHTWLEDAQALVIGTLMIALAITMFQQARLLSGGTAGLAFLGHYATGLRFGVLFFLLNLPFYWLAWRRMGPVFTFKTFACVGLLSLESELLPQWLVLSHVQPLFGAAMGGVLLGTGFLILFRHRASLGGVGILALVLQDRRGWRAGHVQMVIDCAIVAVAFFVVPWEQVAISLVGAVTLNMVLAVNHRPGRYVAQ